MNASPLIHAAVTMRTSEHMQRRTATALCMNAACACVCVCARARVAQFVLLKPGAAAFCWRDHSHRSRAGAFIERQRGVARRAPAPLVGDDAGGARAINVTAGWRRRPISAASALVACHSTHSGDRRAATLTMSSSSYHSSSTITTLAASVAGSVKQPSGVCPSVCLFNLSNVSALFRRCQRTFGLFCPRADALVLYST